MEGVETWCDMCGVADWKARNGYWKWKAAAVEAPPEVDVPPEVFPPCDAFDAPTKRSQHEKIFG